MTRSLHDFDVAVIGGGFAGSLTALLLRQIGERVLLVDRGHHPRFTIGESSTPSSNLLLRSLGKRYNLPELISLSRYGSWKRDFPQLGVGLKRGFSYFGHTVNEPFRTSADHDRELLVAASTHDDVSDTQWLRADFDAWVADRAIRAGAEYLPESRVVAATRTATGWQLDFSSTNSGEAPRERTVTAPFVIEASGLALEFARHLGVTTSSEGFVTNSRAVFAHFADLTRWEECLADLGIPQSDYPFRADDAALHHLFDRGWMWQLRFDSDITSAGFAINQHTAPPPLATPADEWNHWLSRLPSVRDQFARSRIVAPESGLVLMGRLQRRASQLSGPGWVGLPNTAGFIDPLFSAGNAHVLAGVERVVRRLADGRDRSAPDLFDTHARTTFAELAWIDALVGGCYAHLSDFATASAMSAWYFAAAVGYERHRLALGDDELPGAFLLAEDALLRTAHATCRQRVGDATGSKAVAVIRELLAPYDRAGVLDPASRHMIHRSAVE